MCSVFCLNDIARLTLFHLPAGVGMSMPNGGNLSVASKNRLTLSLPWATGSPPPPPPLLPIFPPPLPPGGGPEEEGSTEVENRLWETSPDTEESDLRRASWELVWSCLFWNRKEEKMCVTYQQKIKQKIRTSKKDICNGHNDSISTDNKWNLPWKHVKNSAALTIGVGSSPAGRHVRQLLLKSPLCAIEKRDCVLYVTLFVLQFCVREKD